jgi:hypothetical protein
MTANKQDSAITVRFSADEKEVVLSALSVYGNPAIVARMIIKAFADGHARHKLMLWPPECTPAEPPELTPQLLQKLEMLMAAMNSKMQLIAAEHPKDYKTKRDT